MLVAISPPIRAGNGRYYHGSMDRAIYWDGIYEARGPERVSWFEADPATSMGFVRLAIEAGARSAIDVGGGASRLVDALLEESLEPVAVMDISERALSTSRDRLGDAANRVRWILGDVTELDQVGSFDIWHDRAVFHFLIDEADRSRYLELMARTVPAGGFVIMATFAQDGPDRCSGLEVSRYGPDELSNELGSRYRLVDDLSRTHVTPRGVEQRFIHALFHRE
jgi:ubiquinone/menaquinone biosynthesis C-methylase UbiE